MEKVIVEGIIPILIIMVLGFFCGKFKFFDDDQRQGINKLVLNIALPAALFVSIVGVTRQMLAQDITLTIMGFVGVIIMFLLCFFLCRLIFKRDIQEAAVCALIAGSPAIGLLGFTVLDPIYGNTIDTNLAIAVISIAVSAITIPVGYYLINLGQSKAKEKAAKALAYKAPATHPDVLEAPISEAEARDHYFRTGEVKEISVDTPSGQRKSAKEKKDMNMHVAAILNALKQPVCWAPLLALVFVLIGIPVPEQIYPTFDLIARSTFGIMVLAAGIALSTVKFSLNLEVIWNTFYRLILTPAVFLLIGTLCGLAGEGDMLATLVMSAALPTAFSGIIIASRYNIYVREGASTAVVSTICFVVTCIFWTWIIPLVAHMF